MSDVQYEQFQFLFNFVITTVEKANSFENEQFFLRIDYSAHYFKRNTICILMSTGQKIGCEKNSTRNVHLIGTVLRVNQK